MTVLLLVVICAFVGIKCETGCSDDGCVCHPDSICHPTFATNNPCHSTEKGCYGPVIVTVFTMNVNESVIQSFLPDDLQVISNNLNTYPMMNNSNNDD